MTFPTAFPAITKTVREKSEAENRVFVGGWVSVVVSGGRKRAVVGGRLTDSRRQCGWFPVERKEAREGVRETGRWRHREREGSVVSWWLGETEGERRRTEG